jgi:uncharacterized membrane protein
MPVPADRHATLRHRLRVGLGVFFIVAGLAHFAMPRVYETMMPPWLPAHAALIALSGLAEVAGGVGVLLPRFRRAAAWGLIALLIAIFPANIHVALDPGAGDAFSAAALDLPRLLLLLRLPFQAVFIAWIWWTCLARPAGVTAAARD